MSDLDITKYFVRDKRPVLCCECKLPANGFLKTTKKLELDVARQFGIRKEENIPKAGRIDFFCAGHMYAAISLLKRRPEEKALFGFELYNTNGELINV